VKKYQHFKPCLYTNKGYMSSVKNTHKLTSLYKIGLFKGWQKNICDQILEFESCIFDKLISINWHLNIVITS